MNRRLRSFLLGALLLVSLGACEQRAEDGLDNSAQAYYFLESLKQIESGGRRLQSTGLSQAELGQALEALDQGLGLAFQVQRNYLDQLDLRLGKNYQRYFIEGVENYRIGIEAGDESQQREGLRLLQKWAEFWAVEQGAILARMNPG